MIGKIKQWIKKHVYAAFIGLSILYALGIHILFHIYPKCTWLVAKWGPGDILTYASTISLGLLAIWQNNKFQQENEETQAKFERLNTEANKISLKLLDLENERNKLASQPSVLVTNWRLYKISYDELVCDPSKLFVCVKPSILNTFHRNTYQKDIECLCLTFYNTTNLFVSVEFQPNFSDIDCGYIGQMKRKLTLPAATGDEIGFCAPIGFFKKYEGKNIEMKLILENYLGERFKETFNMLLARIIDNSNNSNDNTQYYCDIQCTNYKIVKFDNMKSEDNSHDQNETGNA